MTAPLDRRDHLVLAAATADLTPDELRELEQLAAADPGVRGEIDVMRELLARVDRVGGWTDLEPSARLTDSITSLGVEPPAGRRRAAPVTHVGPRRPARWRTVAAAAALVAVGAGGAIGAQQLLGDSGDTVVAGPPGTLGASEPVTFESGSAGQVDGSVMAHTWGTEADLVITGLEPGATYDVVFVAADGSTVDAGSFLGSEVEITCELNAAIMRDAVAEVRILTRDGSTVSSADLPPVAS